MYSRDFHFLNDYPDVLQWWKKWKWEAVPYQFLPPTGIMIEKNNKKLCCCWIYKTDSAFCVIDYFVMNPFLKKEERRGCVDFLIKEALKRAKQMGYQMANTFTSHPNLIKTLEKNGYIKHTDLTKLLRGL